MSLQREAYEKNRAIKSTIENALGLDGWCALKDATKVAVWKKYFEATLHSYLVAARETVTVADDDWRDEFEENLENAKAEIQLAGTVEDALDVFCAALIRQSYLQLGMVPRRLGAPSHNAKRGAKTWRLDGFRSVQYVQTREQRENHIVSLLKAGTDEETPVEPQREIEPVEPNHQSKGWALASTRSRQLH